MRKVLKIIGYLFLVFIVLVAFVFIKATLTPAVPKNYTKVTTTGGELEEKYLQNGNYEVRYIEFKTNEPFKKYEVYYPDTIQTEDHIYPLVIFANGTEIKGSKYKALFRHLASWGFIVAGNEDESSGDGISTDKTLMFMINANNDPNSIFYQKIDTDNIGVSGHSQGGAGALSAVSICDHKELFKTVVALSPTFEELAHGLGWNYELDNIHIPVLFLAGTMGDFETQTVIPTIQLQEMYERTDVPKVMARRKEAEHGDMLYQADGYVTAWFMWQLQDDQIAAEAFTGDQQELMRNRIYQEQRFDLGE